MGTFTVPIEVGDLEGGNFAAMDALVDTGATYSLVPSDVLAELNVLSHETDCFSLADEGVVEYHLGYARLRFERREIIALVIFAPEGSTPLLGTTALEDTRLGVDPINERLISITGLLEEATSGNGQLPAGH